MSMHGFQSVAVWQRLTADKPPNWIEWRCMCNMCSHTTRSYMFIHVVCYECAHSGPSVLRTFVVHSWQGRLVMTRNLTVTVHYTCNCNGIFCWVIDRFIMMIKLAFSSARCMHDNCSQLLCVTEVVDYPIHVHVPPIRCRACYCCRCYGRYLYSRFDFVAVILWKMQR